MDYTVWEESDTTATFTVTFIVVLIQLSIFLECQVEVVSMLAGHSSFLRHVWHRSVFCLFVCFLRDSGISVERTVGSVSVSLFV